jgi:hypothetical protein
MTDPADELTSSPNAQPVGQSSTDRVSDHIAA